MRDYPGRLSQEGCKVWKLYRTLDHRKQDSKLPTLANPIWPSAGEVGLYSATRVQAPSRPKAFGGLVDLLEPREFWQLYHHEVILALPKGHKLSLPAQHEADKIGDLKSTFGTYVELRWIKANARTYTVCQVCRKHLKSTWEGWQRKTTVAVLNGLFSCSFFQQQGFR